MEDRSAAGRRPGRRLRLLTPGPVEVPLATRLAAVAEALHHGTEEYRSMEARVREWLAELMGTEGDVVLLPAPGTGAVESATRSLFRPGESVLVVRSGRFGERWADLCEVAGLRVHTLDVQWGGSVTAEALDEALRRSPEILGVCVVHGETSTGARADLRAIGAGVAGRALVVADAIGTLGMDEMRMDAWGVDAVAGAAQKGLLGYPGLSWVALGRRARERVGRPGADTYHLDLDRHLRAMRSGSHVCTPAIVQTAALHHSLSELRACGWTDAFDRVRSMSEAFRDGAAALGLEPLCRTGRMNGLTVLRLPDGLAAGELVAAARMDGDLLFADGLGREKARSLRVLFTAAMTLDTVIAALAALEAGLRRAGRTTAPAGAVEAALARWRATPREGVREGAADR